MSGERWEQQQAYCAFQFWTEAVSISQHLKQSITWFLGILRKDLPLQVPAWKRNLLISARVSLFLYDTGSWILGAGWKGATYFLASFPSICRLDVSPRGIMEDLQEDLLLAAAGSQVSLQCETGLAVLWVRLWIVKWTNGWKIWMLSFRSSLCFLCMGTDNFTREADVLSLQFSCPCRHIPSYSCKKPFLPLPTHWRRSYAGATMVMKPL